MAVILPAPFMLLELLVGLVQASVFGMLTLVYLTVMSSAPHEVISIVIVRRKDEAIPLN